MKKILYVIVSLLAVAGIIIILLISNQNTSVDESERDVSNLTPEEGRALEEMYLRYAMHLSLLPYANIEVASINNIATGTDAFGNYVELHMFPDQPLVNNGKRSEISIDYPYKENDTVEYSWEFKIPADFVPDTPQNRWWVIADWHDQPDPTLGETWDTYETNSTPIIFGYGNIDGTDMLSLSTGSWRSENGVEPRGIVPIKRDVWHKMRVVVLWSQQETGRVTVFLDGAKEPIFDVRGQNMVNGYQHYMKIGQYRHRDIQTKNSISVKNISIMEQ